MIIDTHCHLYTEEFDADRDQAVERMKSAGVCHAVLPNIDKESVAPMLSLQGKYNELFSVCLGLHPTEVGDDYKSEINEIFSTDCDITAIGEIGIDLYWDKSQKVAQMDAMRIQMDIAKERNLPVIIHCREALDECLEVVSEFPSVGGVFHCFGGSTDDAQRIMSSGDYMLGIGGVLTYKKAEVRNAVKNIPLERILLETDCPYLAPVPYRGKRNETSYIVNTAMELSKLMETDYETICDVTTQNAKRVFSKINHSEVKN